MGKSASSAWASAPAIFLNWGGRALLLYFIKGSRAKEGVRSLSSCFGCCSALQNQQADQRFWALLATPGCWLLVLCFSHFLQSFFCNTPAPAQFISSPFPLFCFLYALGLHQNLHPCVSSAHVNVSLPGGMRYVVTLFRPQYRCTPRSVFVRV